MLLAYQQPLTPRYYEGKLVVKKENYLPSQIPQHPNCRELLSSLASTPNPIEQKTDEQCQVVQLSHCWDQQHHTSMHLCGSPAEHIDQVLLTPL